MRVPFYKETFVSKLGERSEDGPAEFELSMVFGEDLVRLKSMIFAIMATANTTGDRWTPALQESATGAFRSGPRVFVNGVKNVHNLTAPAAVCRAVGLKVPDRTPDDEEIPIRTGAEFALIAPCIPTLAFEVALEINSLTIKAAIDPRFTERPSGSPSKPAATSGTADAAPSTSSGSATADVQA